MTSGWPPAGDGFHLLIMDLHKELNRLQGEIATEEVVRFFQTLLEGTGTQWDEMQSHQSSAIAKGDLFYLARGHFTAPDAVAMGSFLERLGSRLVFLIDWNWTRKRL